MNAFQWMLLAALYVVIGIALVMHAMQHLRSNPFSDRDFMRMKRDDARNDLALRTAQAAVVLTWLPAVLWMIALMFMRPRFRHART